MAAGPEFFVDQERSELLPDEHGDTLDPIVR